MLSFLKFDSFLEIDLQTGTKAIAYSGLLGSWFVGIFGLATLQIYQDYLDTVLMSLAIYGFVLDFFYAGSCVLVLKAVREVFSLYLVNFLSSNLVFLPQRSDYKLIPWLVISFVNTLSMMAAGVTLVVFWVNQYFYFAAACFLLTTLVTCKLFYIGFSPQNFANLPILSLPRVIDLCLDRGFLALHRLQVPAKDFPIPCDTKGSEL
jgi:hypothetical protein